MDDQGFKLQLDTGDSAAQIEVLIRDTKQYQDGLAALSAEFDKGGMAVLQFIDREKELYDSLLQSADASQKLDVGLNQLQASGLKLQDSLRLDAVKLANQDLKNFESQLTSTMVPLSSVQMSGLKLQESMVGNAGSTFNADKAIKQFSGSLHALSIGRPMYAIGDLSNAINTMAAGSAALAPYLTLISLGTVALGSAAISAYHHWDALKKLISDGLGTTEKVNEFSTSIEKIKEKIKELTDKPIKMSVDYTAIGVLEDKLKELEERKKILESTHESTGEKMVREMATHALTGLSYDSKDLAGSTATVLKSGPLKNYLKGEDADKMSSLPQQIETLKKTLEMPGLDEQASFQMANDLKNAQKELKLLVTKNEQALLQHARDMVADVGRGTFDDITAMQNLTQQFPGAFPPEFISKLNALPSNTEEFKAMTEGAKAQKEESKDIDREKKDAIDKKKDRIAEDQQALRDDQENEQHYAKYKTAQTAAKSAANTAKAKRLAFKDKMAAPGIKAAQVRTKRQARAIMASPMGKMLAAMRGNVRTQPTEEEQMRAAMHGEIAQPPSEEHQQMQFASMIQRALVGEGLAPKGYKGLPLAMEVAGLAAPQFEKNLSGELTGQMLRTNRAGVNAQNAIFNAQLDGFSQAERGFDHLHNRATGMNGYPGMNTREQY